MPDRYKCTACGKTFDKEVVLKETKMIYDNPTIETCNGCVGTLFAPIHFKTIDDAINAEIAGKSSIEWYGEAANQRYLKEQWDALTVEDMDDIMFDDDELRQRLKERIVK